MLSRLMGRRLLSPDSRGFPWSGVLALNYHRVGDGSTSMFDRGLWSCDVEAFADQIRFCKAHFDLITPADLPEVLGRGRGRYILITFDDGYRDNYEVAFPILQGERAPATFFVATGFIDSPRIAWWDEIAWMVRRSERRWVRVRPWLDAPVRFDADREAAVRSLLRTYKTVSVHATSAYLDDIAEATGSGRYDSQQDGHTWMTWDMLRQMRASGMIVGGHTVNHLVLARAPREVQLDEIETCAGRLAAELSEPMRYFSYPVGGSEAFNAATRECLTEVGVKYAFSYYAGYRQFQDWDDYDIRRVPVESSVAAGQFRSILVLPQLFARSRRRSIAAAGQSQ
jgi:peptidoglycan/xylan/chitin deacetylase (PgdA/CDA1 family)